jgi:tRNA1Val (adenine37-N6)-methyltransferase
MEKSANIFRFKKFNVVNERSAMKVNTDGVLLGASMTITGHDRRLLDIGTGTGTIALMAAQRLLGIPGQAGNDWTPNGSVSLREQLGRTLIRRADCNRGQQLLPEAVSEGNDNDVMIDAIDIDEPSASEAAANFRNSPWAESLTAYNMSLDEFAEELNLKGAETGYDLIFSNPPYFEDSLTAPDERKSAARHTSDGLSYRDIFDFATTRLTENGRVALVLPSDQEQAVCRYARMSGLHLSRILRIRTVPRKAPSRMIVEFSRHRTSQPEDTMLTIQSEGQYTHEYLSLTKDFYLFA